MILVKLFVIFTKISLFAIGGAYSFLPLLEKELVERYHWLGKQEFLDILAVVKVFPGAISIKYATYTGYKMAGLWGAIVANIGNILGPAILIIVACSFYTKYKDLTVVKRSFSFVQLSIFAMIIAVAFQLININQLAQVKSLLIIIISFVLFIYTRINPVLIILCSAFLGVILK